MKAMKRTSVVVVAGWGAFNGLLAAIAAIYGEAPLPLLLYGCVVVFLGIAALLVLLSASSGPDEQTDYYRPPGGGGAVLPLAVAAGIGGLGFAYGWWVLGVAVPIALVALALAVRYQRTRAGRG